MLGLSKGAQKQHKYPVPRPTGCAKCANRSMKDDRGDKGARSRREQAIVKVLVFSAIFAPLRSQRFFQSFIEDAEYAEAQSRLRNNYKKFFPS